MKYSPRDDSDAERCINNGTDRKCNMDAMQNCSYHQEKIENNTVCLGGFPNPIRNSHVRYILPLLVFLSCTSELGLY